MSDHWQLGVSLFNDRRFFEAHEAFEDLWRGEPIPSRRKRHFQGLTQLAVAFHHHFAGNLEGARSVLERAVLNLEGAEESFPDLDLPSLRKSLVPWREYLAWDRPGAGSTSSAGALVPPDLPKLVRRGTRSESETIARRP